MRRRIFTGLLDLLILLAVVEQLLFDGEKSSLLIAASLCLLFLVFRKKDATLKISLICVLSYIALIVYWILYARQTWVYCDLSSQSCPTSFGSLCAASLAMLALIYRTFVSKYPVTFERVIGAAAVFAGVTAVMWFIFRGSALRQFTTDSPRAEDLSACAAFVLIFVRVLLAQDIKQWGRGARSCFWGVALVGLTWTAYEVNGVGDGSIELPVQNSEGRVSESFLLPLLVAEDPIFFRHRGVDFKRLHDTLRESLELGYFKRGGSTISMQLAKVLFLSHEKTISRKIKQIMLAVLLERRYSKEEILRAYMEAVPFGEDAVGLSAASLKFFDKLPEALSPEEGMRLVLSIYDPGNYSPLSASQPKIVMYRLITIRARERVYGRALRHDLENFSNLLPPIAKSPVP